MSTISSNQLKELLASLKKQQAKLEELLSEQSRLETLLQKVEASLVNTTAAQKPADLLDNLLEMSDAELLQAIRGGADVNTSNAEGETPLLLAIFGQRSAKVVRALLEAGADANAADHEGNTPLLVAVDDEQFKVVKELIAHGGNVHARNHAGDTALTNAAAWGSTKAVAWLLKHGADPTEVDGAGVSAANLARQQKHIAIANRIDRAAKAGVAHSH